MYPEENRIPKQKFSTTVCVNMEIDIPIEAINAEIAADDMIQKVLNSPMGSLQLWGKSRFKIKGVNVKPHARST